MPRIDTAAADLAARLITAAAFGRILTGVSASVAVADRALTVTIRRAPVSALDAAAVAAGETGIFALSDPVGGEIARLAGLAMAAAGVSKPLRVAVAPHVLAQAQRLPHAA